MKKTSTPPTVRTELPPLPPVLTQEMVRSGEAQRQLDAWWRAVREAIGRLETDVRSRLPTAEDV